MLSSRRPEPVYCPETSTWPPVALAFRKSDPKPEPAPDRTTVYSVAHIGSAATASNSPAQFIKDSVCGRPDGGNRLPSYFMLRKVLYSAAIFVALAGCEKRQNIQEFAL